ncbi:MAG: carbohydrate kinase family protein [Gammaproteobacteria bacterium]
MARILVTGSLAFDYIMRIGGRFSDRLSAPKAGFSAAYVAPSMRRRFGGCAGNIAYGLRRLGMRPMLLAAAGEDFAPYRAHLAACDICDSGVKVIGGEFTAQAFIVNDDDQSQIIVFHPGAAAFAHLQSISDSPSPPNWAIVAPNGKEGMQRFGRELAAANTPFIFDPGQAVGLFSADELREMSSLCRAAIFNQDEYAAFQKITGAPFAAEDGRALLITRGGDGSEVSVAGKTYRTAAAKFGETADTTGCGDAYRAGLLYGLAREWEWRRAIHFASVVAGMKAPHTGGQSYDISAARAEAECARIFGV